MKSSNSSIIRSEISGSAETRHFNEEWCQLKTDSSRGRVVYTEEKWQLLVPINIQYTGHLERHQKVIVGITEFRLSQVACDFNVQISRADQTIEKLLTDQSAYKAD